MLNDDINALADRIFAEIQWEKCDIAVNLDDGGFMFTPIKGLFQERKRKKALFTVSKFLKRGEIFNLIVRLVEEKKLGVRIQSSLGKYQELMRKEE